MIAAGNPNARPEGADTVEVDVDRKLGKRMVLQASAYGYWMHDFLVGVTLPDNFFQYQNAENAQAQGGELELHGRPWDWLDADR